MWPVAVVWPLESPSHGQVLPIGLCTCCEPHWDAGQGPGFGGRNARLCGAWGKTLVFEVAITRKCPELFTPTKAGSLLPG